MSPWGGQILEKSTWLATARDVVLNHHEKYNGAGYPRGIEAQHIPLVARIFAIVDVFDALTSKRPYKEPMSLEKSLGIIQSDAGSHFDPDLVRLFVEIAPAMFQRVSAMSDEAVEGLLRDQAALYFGLR